MNFVTKKLSILKMISKTKKMESRKTEPPPHHLGVVGLGDLLVVVIQEGHQRDLLVEVMRGDHRLGLQGVEIQEGRPQDLLVEVMQEDHRLGLQDVEILEDHQADHRVAEIPEGPQVDHQAEVHQVAHQDEEDQLGHQAEEGRQGHLV